MFQGAVANLAALRDIPPATRVPGLPIWVMDLGVTGERSDHYLFNPDLSGSEFGTILIQPTTGSGRWVRQGRLVHYASAVPAAAPVARGITWVASLTSPTRTIQFLSIGTSGVSDWIPVGNLPLLRSGSPAGTFAPDFVGQIVVDTSGLAQFVATGATNADWVNIS